ncbi:TRAM domain-containing protein, partial [Candidatus Saccharibacteria bacterium]|nr:TRAM domain-containing protein [Candidatus Saccharibacteria bacterium]
MELFILIITLTILAETTIILFRRHLNITASKRKIYVDTSVLIDGRILNIARSGFLEGDLIILRSVLLELQLLADGKDSEKRTRARSGLEVVSELERVININTEILDDGGGKKKVDEELLKFAKENKGAILTLDYNLIKVAEAEKIQTLNINDLSLAIRTEFLPGEKIQVKIVEKGSNRGQGIGYLSNGTMVVVDNAANKIGKNLTLELVRFHETTAGTMIFAKVAKKI